MAKRRVKVTMTLVVEFEEYDTDVKNDRALSSIRKWVVDSVTMESRDGIPLYIQKADGSYLEDHATQKKIEVAAQMK